MNKQCKGCVWSQTEEYMSWCKEHGNGDCDRFWPREEVDNNPEEECKRCKRMKDAGKPCWWCNYK